MRNTCVAHPLQRVLRMLSNDLPPVFGKRNTIITCRLNTCVTCRLNTSLRAVRGKDEGASAAAAAEATTLLLLSLMIPMPGARRWSPADPASVSARNCM